MNDKEIFTHPDHPGLRFRVHVEADDDRDPPWETEDGHGPVRDSHAADKRPGERVLFKDRHTHWFYDWQAATKMARKDGWNVKPYDAPNRIERAVQADFDRLRRWLNNDWCYVGVCVEVIDENDAPLTEKYEHALWGIESDCDDYIAEVARELADQAATEYKKVHAIRLEMDQKHADLKADAERWRKFCRLAQRKDLGTIVQEDGKLRSPMYRRWFIDCVDLSAETLNAALDSVEVPDGQPT